MSGEKRIKSALISVFHKDGLEPILKKMVEQNITLYSTGGTARFIEELGHEVNKVEDLTGYPSILGGRVKTLHPKIFGGILGRSQNIQDQDELAEYAIPTFDLILVDLYPFEETVGSGAAEAEIIEKIDIGGISLIRAAAKNFNDTLILSTREQYPELASILDQGGSTSREKRKSFAQQAFQISSHYDTAIFNYFSQEEPEAAFKVSAAPGKSLRYGENPHQKGYFFGSLDEIFDQIQGKELSYNNLVDIDAATDLLTEFDQTAFVIIKHTNACGVAIADSVKQAYLNAFAADTVSAFGGVLATNAEINQDAAEEIHKLFFDILIAKSFTPEALEILQAKKNRILLVQKKPNSKSQVAKTLINGWLVQDNDHHTDAQEDLKVVTKKHPSSDETAAMLFGSKICKHTKSNAIVLVRKDQMLASGVGQTSRVDALKQAIEKAGNFGFDLRGAVMISDAFFPFSDSVEISAAAGISAILQPGGSIRDKDSINKCDELGVSMAFSGFRHFKH